MVGIWVGPSELHGYVGGGMAAVGCSGMRRWDAQECVDGMLRDVAVGCSGGILRDVAVGWPV